MLSDLELMKWIATLLEAGSDLRFRSEASVPTTSFHRLRFGKRLALARSVGQFSLSVGPGSLWKI